MITFYFIASDPSEILYNKYSTVSYLFLRFRHEHAVRVFAAVAFRIAAGFVEDIHLRAFGKDIRTQQAVLRNPDSRQIRAVFEGVVADECTLFGNFDTDCRDALESAGLNGFGVRGDHEIRCAERNVPFRRDSFLPANPQPSINPDPCPWWRNPHL